MDSDSPEARSEERAERLVREGAHAQAAAEFRRLGNLRRAQELYERIWDFRSAAEVARERGDRLALLRLLLQARDFHAARRLQKELLAAGAGAATRDEQEQAAQLFEQRQLYEEAARLREALLDLPRARDLFQRARLLLEVARLSELLGDHRHAGMVYEEILQGEEAPAGAGEAADDPASPDRLAARGERLRAHLGLVRVLRRFGRHEDAVRNLQRARRLVRDLPAYAAVLGDIDRHLIVELCALGYPGAARRVLHRLYAAEHEQGRSVPTLEAFLDLHQPAPLDAAPRRAEPAQTAEPAPAALLLRRYAVQRLLGSGGMGRVYLAHDLLRDRPVAVKLVPPPPVQLRAGSAARARAGGPRDSYERFVREAQVVQALRHENIVQVFEFHQSEGLLVMEYMPGGTLADREGPLPLSIVRRVLLQVIDGLQAAHACGVIHRDIKPQNIFFTATAEAKLGDFGVAHLQDLSATQTAGFIGTLAYMSPEQIAGARLTFAADIYALGVTAFQMATGRLPFAGPDFVGQHLAEAPPRAGEVRPGLPPAWDELCLRALGKDPAERFGSLDELRRAVEALPVEGTRPLATVPAADRAPAAEREPRLPGYPIDGEVLVERTPHSTLLLGTDTRLGRQVLVERFAPGLLQGLQGAGGAEHLRWLTAMARLGSPGLQRVLRIDLASAPEAQVVFEAPVGPLLPAGGALTAREAALLRRMLDRLHRERVVHGSVRRSVLREEAVPVLLLSGRGPLTWAPSAAPTAAQDLEAIDELGA